MDHNTDGYYDFSDWYSNIPQESGYNGIDSYNAQGHNDPSVFYETAATYSDYGKSYHSDDSGILSDAFAAISGLRKEFETPYMTPATYEEPLPGVEASSPEALSAQSSPIRSPMFGKKVSHATIEEHEEDLSDSSNDDLPVAPSKPSTSRSAARSEQLQSSAGVSASRRPKKHVYSGNLIAELQASIQPPPRQCRVRDEIQSAPRNPSRAAKPASAIFTPRSDYGWPNPDWWRTFPGKREDFNTALQVYLEHTQTRQDPNIAFVCICNTELARDLLSGDKAHVLNASRHIDRGVPLSESEGQLLQIVGVELGWRIYHSVAQRLQCTMDQTMQRIGSILTPEMAESLRSGDPRQYENILRQIANEMPAPVRSISTKTLSEEGTNMSSRSKGRGRAEGRGRGRDMGPA